MATLDAFLGAALEERHRQHRYRQRPLIGSAHSSEVLVDGVLCLDFSSNDYLGLANHPDISDSFQQAVNDYGVGSGASHLVSGHSLHHHALEEELADWLGRERTLLFSTGYMANMGIIDALLDKGDTVFQDRLNHASLIDGGRLTRADFKRYRSIDMNSLEQQISAVTSGHKLVVTDGVFSMDGNLAPLGELSDISARHGAWLMVDDAHGFGCLGKTGGGCVEHFGFSTAEVPIVMGTLGKAFGTFGAFVAGSAGLIEYLIQFARSYVYTTALPPAVAAATRTSLLLVQKDSWRRDKLSALIRLFREKLVREVKGKDGLQLMDSVTPIQPVILGDEALTMVVAQRLRQKGFLVGAIRPPTVPQGAARLRVTLSANHSETQVNGLVDALLSSIDEARAEQTRAEND